MICKTLDDEIKVGTVLLRLRESQLKTHLLMRVDKVKKWTDFTDQVVAISRAIAVAQSQPTPMDIGAVGKEKGSKGAGKRSNQTQHACFRCGNTDHTSANCPHSDKTCRKCGKVGLPGSWLEAANVRGDVANLLVRFRLMNTGKALLSTQDLSRCGWETVFTADCGNAYLVRKASGTRITLVEKRSAWHLGVKLKPHNELPYTESQEFLEVMSNGPESRCAAYG